MAGINIPFLQYKETEWADFSIAMEGAELIKIRGFSYGEESDDEHLHAAGNRPISIQSGNKRPMGRIKMLKGAFDDFVRATQVAGFLSPLDAKFSLVAQYQAAAGRPIQTDTLRGCKISKWEKSMEQGAKFMEVELPFNALDCIST